VAFAPSSDSGDSGSDSRSAHTLGNSIKTGKTRPGAEGFNKKVPIQNPVHFAPRFRAVREKAFHSNTFLRFEI
jgi:hypothetical protein